LAPGLVDLANDAFAAAARDTADVDSADAESSATNRLSNKTPVNIHTSSVVSKIYRRIS
jgi:hypothetical protein